MDPKATIAIIANAIDSGDYQTALDSSNDLRAWYARGGFKPTVHGWPEIDWLLAVRKFGLANANTLFAQL